MKYKVIVHQILAREVEVDAEDVYQAIDMVKEKYNNEEIVLNSSGFSGTEFECGKIITSK